VPVKFTAAYARRLLSRSMKRSTLFFAGNKEQVISRTTH
jgi:hypothetical protein